MAAAISAGCPSGARECVRAISQLASLLQCQGTHGVSITPGCTELARTPFPACRALDRSRFGEQAHARFRCAVSRNVRSRHLAANRRHIDDRPLSGSAQQRQRIFGAEKHAVEIDRQDRAPFLNVVSSDGPEVADAGVVDEHIEAAERTSISCIARIHCSSELTSSIIARCRSSPTCRLLKRCASLSVSRSARMTMAPSCTHCSAVAQPMPDAAPVMSAILPARRPARGVFIPTITPDDLGWKDRARSGNSGLRRASIASARSRIASS